MCITSQKSKKGNILQILTKIISLITRHLAKCPFLCEKNKSREKVTLVKNEEVISDDAEVAKTLNNYFRIIVKNLKIQKKKKKTVTDIHPSMHAIKRFSQRFSSF